VIQTIIPPPPPGSDVIVYAFADRALITRSAAGALVMGFLPVVPMTIVSGILMVVVSLATKSASKPSPATLARYFDVALPRRARH
jgi:hypothetical protein